MSKAHPTRLIVTFLVAMCCASIARAGITITSGLPSSLSLNALSLTPLSPTVTPLNVYAAAGQSTNITQWYNSSGNVVSQILATGKFQGTIASSGIQNAYLQGNITSLPVATIEGMTGQTADLLDVLLTPGGSNEMSINSAGVLNLSQAPTSSAPCATGFTRITPNFCLATAAVTMSAATGNGGCTESAAISGVTDATAVLVHVETIIGSSNLAGAFDNDNVQFFLGSDTTCSGASQGYVWDQLYEFTAVSPSGSNLAHHMWQRILPSSASGQYYYEEQNGNGSINLGVYGYFD